MLSVIPAPSLRKSTKGAQHESLTPPNQTKSCLNWEGILPQKPTPATGNCFLAHSGEKQMIFSHFMKSELLNPENKHDMTLLPLQCQASHMSPLLPGDGMT